MKIYQNMKAWMKEHEDGLKTAGILIGTAAVGFGYGYLIRSNKATIDELKISNGLQRCLDVNAIILRDPRFQSNEPSIPVENWINVTKEYFKSRD